MRPVILVFLVGAIMVLLFAASAFQSPDGDDDAGEHHDGADSDEGHDGADTDGGHAPESPGGAPESDGNDETPAADDAPETPSGDETPETPAADDTPETPGADDTPDVPAPQDETGNFQLLISDKPADIGDFDFLKVCLSQARVHFNNTNASGNATGNETGNWTLLDLNNTWVDLTTLVGNKSLPVLNATLAPGNYTKVEMYVCDINASVDNGTADVKVPSGKLMITMNFTVEANKTTMFVFDMHVVKKGNGGYNLRPVITESGVVGKDLEDVVIVG